MSVSSDTYIVISLMFAVFAAVAAVGSSVVLGAGFERLRAAFDQVRRQSGFFADAIHKLDQRTQRLDEETMRLKSGASSMSDRVTRVEKQASFMGEAINDLEARILHGSPQQTPVQTAPAVRLSPSGAAVVQEPKMEIHGSIRQRDWSRPMPLEMNVEMPQPLDDVRLPLIRAQAEQSGTDMAESDRGPGQATLSSLISSYFTAENSGGGRIIYH